MSEVLSRRERVRLETTSEIKQRAWTLMADAGPEAVSLREVARQMGMAPSALYRYFAGRDELLTALIVDGYRGLGTTIRAAYDAGRERGESATELWVTVAKAYRRWAVEHPTEFSLVYSTTIPDYQGTEETKAAATQVHGVLLDVLTHFLDEGLIDLERIAAEIEGPYAEELGRWAATSDRDLPVPALAVAMRHWAALHGLVHLEMNNHFPPPVAHSEAQLEATMRAISASVRRP